MGCDVYLHGKNHSIHLICYVCGEEIDDERDSDHTECREGDSLRANIEIEGDHETR